MSLMRKYEDAVDSALATHSRGILPIELSVVIPAWNEEKNIYKTLDEMHKDIPEKVIEVIVVDDGSTDSTCNEVRRWIGNHPTQFVRLVECNHAGKGASIVAGVLASKGKNVGFIDADLDIQPSELWHIYSVLERDNMDIVVGSKRSLSWQERGVSFSRRFISITFSLVNRILFNLPIKDTQTGCKIFNGDWLRHTIHKIQVQGYLFDLEILGHAASSKLKMKEVPIKIERLVQTNRINIKIIMKSLKELGQIFWNLRVKRLGSKEKHVIRTEDIAHAHIDAQLERS